jgi:exosome complex exonuclease RRP6
MGINEPPKVVVEEPIGVSEISHHEESLDVPATGSSLQDIILLDNDSDMEQNTHIAEPDRDDSKTTNANGDDKSSGSALETDGEEPVSLADLSMSFQKCFPSGNQNKKTAEVKKSGEPSGGLKLKPFDYTTALRSGEDPAGRLKVGSAKNQRGVLDSVGTIKSSSPGAKMQKDDETGEYRQGRRRQAFPATGNRSATFR